MASAEVSKTPDQMSVRRYAQALDAAKNSLDQIMHYPAHDQEPALTHLSLFICPEDPSYLRERLIMGNGASELIGMFRLVTLQIC